MITSRYYTEQDFQSAVPKCSLQDMQQSTIDKLDALADIRGKKERFTSAFRTKAHDQSKGRSGNGSHPQGHGVDCHCENISYRNDLERDARSVGFNRIGKANTFLHVDDSPTLPQNVTWNY